MTPLQRTLGIAASFLLGSFPTGYLLGRALKGIDIREHGSGNPGATNVFRVVGKPAGALTLLIDLLKGFLPVLAASKLEPGNVLWASAVGLAATAGHNWSVFLRFKGGKGVATSAGVFLALAPIPTAISGLFFVLGLYASGHVSVGSMTGAAAMCASMWFVTGSKFLTALSVFCALLIFYLHRKNISRLLRHEEPKFTLGEKNGR